MCIMYKLIITIIFIFYQGNGSFITQLREMETFNNDIHQNCRKIRRRVPTNQSGKSVICPSGLIPVLINQQKALVTNFRALYNRVHQKSQGLSGNTCSY